MGMDYAGAQEKLGLEGVALTTQSTKKTVWARKGVYGARLLTSRRGRTQDPSPAPAEKGFSGVQALKLRQR